MNPVELQQLNPMRILLNFRKFSVRSASISRSISGYRFSDVKTSLGRCWAKLRAGDLSLKRWAAQKPNLKIRPERISAWVTVVLVVLMVGMSAYWVMRIAQVSFPSTMSGKGVLFYKSGSDQAVRSLFGEKSFDSSRLVLRGIVITGTAGGANQGMALIEVDGKTADAVSVGEMVPPGVRLEKISPEGVVVTYQGKEISLQQSFDSAAGKSQ